MNALVWLSDPLCREPEIAGNKAAALAQLLQLGYPVPTGFCLRAAPPLIPSHISEQGFITGLYEALAKLSSPWVVRSSSTLEDSRAAAFPGVFRTVLGVNDFDSVQQAISEVIASAVSSLAQKYGDAQQLDLSAIKMATLVQTLIQADVSGVAFSRDPTEGTSDVVIEANYGIGDTLVDGSISPDRLHVTQNGRTIVSRIGSKRLKSIYISNRLSRVATTGQEQRQLSLDHMTARRIALVVRELEHHFQQPQDVEWAVMGQAVFILQSRPITNYPAL